jgi:hypothetical protein
MRSISLKITPKQLVEGLRQLSDEELEELELLLLRDELEKRSKEVKSGKSLRLEELKALANV